MFCANTVTAYGSRGLGMPGGPRINLLWLLRND